MKTLLLAAVCLFASSVIATSFVCEASDWTRFRGPQGSGIADDTAVPLEWSSDKNLAWRSPLPGKGTSSPVVAGDRVYLTAYTGYGIDPSNPGTKGDLVRHVIAFDRKTGAEVWRASIEATGDEDPYEGFITQHGYASSSVAVDGDTVFALLGKSGLFAFDRSGKQLWQLDLGQMSDPAKWGDGSSPIVVGDMVVVDAGVLGHHLVGVNKQTGTLVWSIDDKSFTNSWSTPTAVDVDGATQVLFNLPGQVVAVDPTNGKKLWTANTPLGDSACGGIVVSHGRGFLMGGREGNAMGFKLGGAGDVSDTNTLWKTRLRSSIATPIVVGDSMFWASGGIFYAAGLDDGEAIYKERLPRLGKPTGGFPNADYSSPIAVGGNIIQFTRSGESYVIAAGDKLNIVSHNPAFDGDDSAFSATPAVSDGQLFVRSDKFLYCIGE